MPPAQVTTAPIMTELVVYITEPKEGANVEEHVNAGIV